MIIMSMVDKGMNIMTVQRYDYHDCTEVWISLLYRGMIIMTVQRYDYHDCTEVWSSWLYRGMIIMTVQRYDRHDCNEVWSSWLYRGMIVMTVMRYDYPDYVSEAGLPALMGTIYIHPHVPRPAAGGGWTCGRSGWMAGEWTPPPPCTTAPWTVSAAPSRSRPCWSPDLTWAPANRQQSTRLCKGDGVNCANLKGNGVNCANLRRQSELC